MIRVLVADDHKLVRQMMKSAISGEDDLEFVGEAENGTKALQMVAQEKPDVLILDMSMPGLTGVQVIRELRHQAPEVKVLVLTAVEDETYLFESLAAGDADPPSLAHRALRLVQRSEVRVASSDRISATVLRAVRVTPMSVAEAAPVQSP